MGGQFWGRGFGRGGLKKPTNKKIGISGRKL